MLTRLALVGTLLLSFAASFGGETRYILRYTDQEPFAQFLSRYGLVQVARVSGRPIYSLRDPQGRNPDALIAQVDGENDEDVSMERDQILIHPIRSFTTRQTSQQGIVQTAVNQSSLLTFFGTQVPLGFINQSSVRQVRANTSWSPHGTGAGVVAVVDTGVDLNHPFLAGRLVPGTDMLNAGNGSEFTGLSQEILALINPTTTPLLGRRVRFTSNAIASAWEPSLADSPTLGTLPAALGHGTMVAGAIRMVAPGARIMPIRAFTQSGVGRLFDVIRSIHFAEDRGARIVNLSLNTYTHSPELERTVNEVSDRGIVLVASAGNDARLGTPSYPASYPRVTGVASVGPTNVRSLFSNGGSGVAWASAPGEAIYLPYPGNRWAGGWGTSFAAPMVSGLASKLLARKANLTFSDLQSALSRSQPTSDPNLGLGILDVFQSVAGF